MTVFRREGESVLRYDRYVCMRQRQPKAINDDKGMTERDVDCEACVDPNEESS